jgi:intracellular sulfur oxidation DsrE/DsrF family protein
MRRAAALALLTLLACARVLAAPADEVARLVAAHEPPPGVVFEVVTGDESALDRILPVIRAHARTLRERFPGLPVAVLTHGSEQFSLLSENAGRYATLHALVADLGQRDDIPVQVCGNHASWRSKGREDFAAEVEVVSSAGTKLSEYRAAGYAVIVM